MEPEPEPQETKKQFKDMTVEERREYNRKAKQESRARQAETIKLAAQKVAEKEQAEFLKKCLKFNACYFGEIAPNQSAPNAEEELQISREFCRALHLPDIADGETIRDFVLRVLRQWAKEPEGALAFNRATQRFMREIRFDIHPEDLADVLMTYKFPEGCDAPVDLAQLPELPPRPGIDDVPKHIVNFKASEEYSKKMKEAQIQGEVERQQQKDFENQLEVKKAILRDWRTLGSFHD